MTLLPVLTLLLLLSGISALVYQVLWLRLLSLTFGLTIYAASTVLMSFMAGLALGSALAGRLADRARHPIRWFGAVELLIGLCALCTPLALNGVHRVHDEIFRRLPDAMAIATTGSFLLSFAVLIVPTALMGATLPLVMKSSLTRRDRLGSRLSVLYATNTAGAILYSVEYFRLVRAALAPNGIALHWNGGGTDGEYGLILRAFVKAFPYTTLWGDGKLMIGSNAPVTLSRQRIERMLSEPETRQILGLMNVESFDHLARTFRAGPEQLRALVKQEPHLSDDKPVIEYFALPPAEADVHSDQLHGDLHSILRP